MALSHLSFLPSLLNYPSHHTFPSPRLPSLLRHQLLLPQIRALDGSNSKSLEAFPGRQPPSVHFNNAASHLVQAVPIRAASVVAANTERTVGNSELDNSSVATSIPGVQQAGKFDPEEMREWIDTIKGMFRSMTLGEISISAYDTAWVALVPALDGSEGPQFPKSLEWIVQNQLPDGSWGDREMFLAYDRVCSTLACVVALKTWNLGEENVKRGLDFIHGNVAKMAVEVDDYMPIGFEIVFPAMLEDAKELGLDLPYDSPMVIRIQEERERKLKRIPMEILHSHPTTLLHSLEGLGKIVDWKKLLKLQLKNGSFLFSPASTACALKYTGDKKCLQYLTSILEKFDNAVPNVYPVDMFEHLWIVDRLERLGISRYFKSEIKGCLDYVFRYWTKNGIAWASESNVYDADDTAMGFRLLRLHGYDVGPEVFSRFKKDGQFFCFEGQTSQAITGMYNLYRASQTMLPGETILREIKQFTREFLQDKLNKNQIQDKWIISEGLQGEVEYALKYPWYASLPRIETRQYLDQYGVHDIWIGKSLYKMPYVNNTTFLKLAKADYNLCQSFHQKEIAQMVRWNKECQFDALTFSRQKPIECFVSATATMFEPKFSIFRLVWAKCGVLATVIDDFFDVKGSLQELSEFCDAVKRWDPTLTKGFSQEMKILFMGLYNTVNSINQEAFVFQGRDITPHLRHFWVRLLDTILMESRWTQSNYSPSFEEYMEFAVPSIALEPVLQSSLFFVGEKLSEEVIMGKEQYKLMQLVNIVGRLNNDIQGYKRETSEGKCSSVNIYLRENPSATEEEAINHFKNIIEQSTSLLLQEVLRHTSFPKSCKQVHFYTARIMNFFYQKTDGFSSLTEMKKHVVSVVHASLP